VKEEHEKEEKRKAKRNGGSTPCDFGKGKPDSPRKRGEGEMV